MITKENPSIVMVFPDRVSVSILNDRLLAVVYKPVGSFQVQQSFERIVNHVDDLHNLNLRGITNLAREFYDEIKQQLGGINK